MVRCSVRFRPKAHVRSASNGYSAKFIAIPMADFRRNFGEEKVTVSTRSTPDSTDVGSRMSLLPSSRLGRGTQPVLQQRIDCQRSGTSEHDEQQR
jgi:hypothetical protein